jgi:hypothetical protein
MQIGNFMFQICRHTKYLYFRAFNDFLEIFSSITYAVCREKRPAATREGAGACPATVAIPALPGLATDFARTLTLW